MLVSSITAVSNKAALLRGIIPVRVVQIEACVVDTEKRCIYNFQSRIIYNWNMTTRLHEKVITSIQNV